MAELDSKLLYELFEYRDGEIYAKVLNTSRKNTSVGHISPSGYKLTGIGNNVYLNHLF